MIVTKGICQWHLISLGLTFSREKGWGRQKPFSICCLPAADATATASLQRIQNLAKISVFSSQKWQKLTQTSNKPNKSPKPTHRTGVLRQDKNEVETATAAAKSWTSSGLFFCIFGSQKCKKSLKKRPNKNRGKTAFHLLVSWSYCCSCSLELQNLGHHLGRIPARIFCC